MDSWKPRLDARTIVKKGFWNHIFRQKKSYMSEYNLFTITKAQLESTLITPWANPFDRTPQSY